MCTDGLCCNSFARFNDDASFANPVALVLAEALVRQPAQLGSRVIAAQGLKDNTDLLLG